MKNAFICLSHLLLVICLWGAENLNAQQNHPIVGSWVFEQGPSFASMSNEIKLQLDEFPDLKQQVFAGYLNRILIFHPDGSFQQIQGSTGLATSGSWQIFNDIELHITDSSGRKLIQTIGEISQNRLVLRQPWSSGSQPVLPMLFFSKSN